MDGRRDELIKKTVRESYGAIGRGTAGSCCGGADLQPVTIEMGYTEEMLQGVPDGSNLGLGCGNPHAFAAIREGDTVLDLGSGAGFDCFIAARAAGERGRVIGVDMTPEMIERARENAQKSGIRNVEFRLGEIERLPVEDESVDVVLSNCVINLSTDKEAVYREAFRVLKPGGRLAISDIALQKTLPPHLRDDLQLYAGCVGGAIAKEEIADILRRAGFADSSIRPRETGSATVSGWAPGERLEDYIYPAYITGVKPAGGDKNKKKFR